MKLENYIHVENDAIPTEFCDEIIREYENSDDWVPGTVNDYNICLLYTSPSPRDS